MRGVGSLAVLLMALAATNTFAAQDAAQCNLHCDQGETCKLQQVQCIKAPCDPVPTCVPIEAPCTKTCPKNEVCQVDSYGSQYCYNPCAATTCLTGTVCVVEQVQCIRAPCPPIATCKPIKKPCATRRLKATSNN
ncbi:hypothetical protein PHMEG_00018241 [Phytophthora megakarya]|uniref:Cysteine-rich protein n=1 Tax=Phytophthora megakarya TaxID=4795 RepID=A0A225VX25_9STRA|nr:hypothetical protein PHMEG_00018241 [Phytophthora megakarya]